ncbi:MAG: acyl-CoA dehydrogenase, partial [Deltaproteobacteria bacterium]
QKQELLPRVADGSLLVALAYHERGTRYNVGAVSTRVEETGGGYRLSGEKTLVWHGHAADLLVVSARVGGAGGELGLFLVPGDAPGLSRARQWTMHLRPAAVVKFDGVEIGTEARLGDSGDQTALLEQVIDGATLGLSAEMLGSAQAAAEMTLDYLKTREQFGVPIGSFQALKHRAAKLFIEIELARSAVLGACEAIDEGRDDAAALVSVAKAQCCEAVVLAGYEGIQMHGGIGMTDEHDIGLFAKRARGDELTFGDAAYHRDRFARLSGF